MPSDQKPVGRGPMIHIRLNPDIHKDLKMDAVEKGTTIQTSGGKSDLPVFEERR